MSRRNLAVTGALGVMLLVLAAGARTPARAAGPDWAAKMTVIEACSCPMFCQCYFNTKPAGHGDHGGEAKHFCRANNAYKITAGHYGATSLDGAKFWVAADLGDDFSDGEMDWGVLYFDKPLSQPQRDAIQTIVGQLFPVKWKSLKTAEGSIDKWEFDKDGAHALLDSGKTGEVKLKAFPGMGGGPVVMKNLPYWGAPRNEGFVMMPNEVEAYRVGPNAFEFKGTNGFMLTLDISSKDIKPPAAN
jgi:Protein of unknown function (DUF1326)